MQMDDRGKKCMIGRLVKIRVKWAGHVEIMNEECLRGMTHTNVYLFIYLYCLELYFVSVNYLVFYVKRSELRKETAQYKIYVLLLMYCLNQDQRRRVEGDVF